MILQLASNRYIDVESYGVKTWGSFSQTSIIKKDDNNWYVRTSSCKDLENDCWVNYDHKLNVIAEYDILPNNIVLYNQDEVDCLNDILGRR